MSQRGYQIETEVFKLAVVQPPPKVARELRIGSADPVILLDRRRSILHEPILLVTSYLPEKLCPSLVQEDFTQQSLYQTLREKYGLHVRSAKPFHGGGRCERIGSRNVGSSSWRAVITHRKHRLSGGWHANRIFQS
jgi:DNA-binding GntR family transcriptional regulator